MYYLMYFSKFSYVLPAFTCANAIGNLLSICLKVNTLSPLSCVAFPINILPLS